MSSNSTAAILFTDLVASNEEWKDGNGKAQIIIGGVAAILSVMSSLLLIFIIARSRDRLRTTYHRLVMGMSISDILYSACFMTFNTMAPSDISYQRWNARGNQATCSAMGFLIQAGLTASLFYSCSLNMNYLAVVKYNCSEAYIRSKIEPFLHAFPVALALAFSVVPLVGENYNGNGGYCQFSPVYEPPHCTGFDNGQVRDGFKIRCGRGRDGFPTFYWVSFSLDMFIPPIIIGVSLAMMYKKVRRQENRTARYGAGALDLNAPGPANGAAAGTAADGGEGGRGRIGRLTLLSAPLAMIFRRRAATNPERPISRAVMQRAAAYSFAFFLTWSWTIIIFITLLAMGGKPDPRPNWYIALGYPVFIFNPLQGFVNLMIYMQPKVTNARKFRGRDLVWRQAIARAFRTSLGLGWRGGNAPPAADAGRGNDGGWREHREPPAEEERAEVVGANDVESTGSPAEEEKVEIQDPQKN